MRNKTTYLWQISKKNHARGFEHTGGVLSKAVRAVSSTRGFAESRLLTRWSEICGPDIARIAQPVKVTYTRGAMGATLIVTCDGARAAEVQMQSETIRTRVNACYGYNAISRVRISQTDSHGFAEAQDQYRTKDPAPVAVPPEVRDRAQKDVSGIDDAGLRHALRALGENILTRRAGHD